MKRLFSFVLVFLAVISTPQLDASSPDVQPPNSLQWHSFDWYQGHNSYFSQTPHRTIVSDFTIGGLPDKQRFMLDLGSPFSLLYDYAYESIVYRNPSFANRTETVQRVSNYNEQIVKGMELVINRQVLGDDNMKLQPTTEANRNIELKGQLGFGIFHRNQKILVLDLPGKKWAVSDALPTEIEERAIFSPMRVEMGYLVVPLVFDGKTINMFFDGSSRPAMVVFQNRTFRVLSSGDAAAEKLNYKYADGATAMLEGFKLSGDVFFNNLKLAPYDIYLSDDNAPSDIRGFVSRAFFDDYILIFDYKNGRFGVVNPDSLAK